MKSWLLIIIVITFWGPAPPISKATTHQLTLGGKVIDAQTNQPLPGVHVYIESGEEEAFSDKAGKFKIQSWKKFPLRLYAEHKDFQKQSLQINAASESIELKLQKK